MDYCHVLPRLLFGPHPRSARDIDLLAQKEGVTAVLNLQTDEDITSLALDWDAIVSHYKQADIQLQRIPIHDFNPESLQEHLPAAVEQLARLLQEGHTVFVHCNAGAGRSPSIIVAYLHWVHGWELFDADAFVQSRRLCSPDLDAIRAATDRWHARQSDPEDSAPGG